MATISIYPRYFMERHCRPVARHFDSGDIHIPHQGLSPHFGCFNRFRSTYCVCRIRTRVADDRFNRVKGALSALPSTLQALLQAKVSLERLTNYMNQPEIDPPMGEPGGRIVCENATIGWPAEEKDGSTPLLNAPFTLKGLDLEPPQNQMTIVCGPLGSGKTLFVS